MSGSMKIPLEIVIGVGGGFLMLLIFVHIVLLFLNVMKITEQGRLKKEWTTLAPQKQQVDDILMKLRTLNSNFDSIKSVTGEADISWSEKLNILSDVLPREIWLQRVAYIDGVLYIEGSAISKEHREMLVVHGFASNLKKEARFLEGLTNVEFGSIERRRIQQIEVADFLMTAKRIEK